MCAIGATREDETSDPSRLSRKSRANNERRVTDSVAEVVKWQTRTFEGRVAQAVRVQVPPSAPNLISVYLSVWKKLPRHGLELSFPAYSVSLILAIPITAYLTTRTSRFLFLSNVRPAGTLTSLTVKRPGCKLLVSCLRFQVSGAVSSTLKREICTRKYKLQIRNRESQATHTTLIRALDRSLRRCRSVIDTADDGLFVCPLSKEMVQFKNIYWKTPRAGSQGPESFTEAEVQDAIYSCRR